MARVCRAPGAFYFWVKRAAIHQEQVESRRQEAASSVASPLRGDCRLAVHHFQMTRDVRIHVGRSILSQDRIRMAIVWNDMTGV
jgi:hypothetical protein